MPITISSRTIIRAGALAGAIGAIGGALIGAWAIAKPLALSDPPPWSGFQRIHSVETQVAGLTQTDAQTQQYLKTMQQQVLFLAQQNWTLVQSNAQAQLRQNPNNLAARQQLNTANQALYGIQRQLYGK